MRLAPDVHNQELHGRRRFFKVAAGAMVGGGVAMQPGVAEAARRPRLLKSVGRPKASQGRYGDFYLDMLTGLLYGPKVKTPKRSKRWGSPTRLSGLTGPAGPAGAGGGAGPAGANGAAGTPGAPGAGGATGATGTAGPTGSTGAPGATGTAGPTGSTGAPGAPGAPGATGPAGAPGTIGPTGPKGDPGAPGEPNRGTVILMGSTPPAPGLGEDGAFYIDTTTTQIYGPRTSGLWGSPTNLTGPSSPADNPVYVALARVPEALISGAINRDAAGAITSADVVWPDGTPGRLETTPSEAFPGAVNAYTVTYGQPVTRTFRQPAVSRHPDTGAVVQRPSIVVS